MAYMTPRISEKYIRDLNQILLNDPNYVNGYKWAGVTKATAEAIVQLKKA